MKQTTVNLNDLPEYDYLKPASTQDCTGLIPAGPVDEHELSCYEDLYAFLPPVYATHTGKGEET